MFHLQKTAGIDRGAEDLSKLILERTTLQKRVSCLQKSEQFYAQLCNMHFSRAHYLLACLKLCRVSKGLLQVASLETENQQLISNISQLYKTARQELQWKENELRQLRGQIDWQTKVGSNLNMERRPTAAGGD